MLVPSMNFDEIRVEANAEYDILTKSTTISRLTYEYVSERFKNKVKRNEPYPRFYTIKSKKKNNWLIVTPNKLHRRNKPISFFCIRSFGKNNNLIIQNKIVAPAIRKNIKVVGERKAGITPLAMICPAAYKVLTKSNAKCALQVDDIKY
jgi:hypothetical protein